MGLRDFKGAKMGIPRSAFISVIVAIIAALLGSAGIARESALTG